MSDAHVVRDRTTGQSRGFGFVTFVDPAVARAVMMTDHKIDGRDVMAIDESSPAAWAAKQAGGEASLAPPSSAAAGPLSAVGASQAAHMSASPSETQLRWVSPAATIACVSSIPARSCAADQFVVPAVLVSINSGSARRLMHPATLTLCPAWVHAPRAHPLFPPPDR